ncbi:MAG: TIGR03364 family FAD-dependent oxidoreductase [Cyanobacteriota bacterium]|nr:TIGR03364 family FAD-dependent oxidoreductase [Cyanobacteriota bacterium]
MNPVDFPANLPTIASGTTTNSGLQKVDVAIVGAGIVGLAYALAAAKRGWKVTVFERNPYAVGASIRNFGMIWPIGQPIGKLLERAMRSRQIWLEVAEAAGMDLETCGSLHLAYRTDEWAVIEEFAATRQQAGYQIELFNPAQTLEKSPAVVSQGLLGSLWSATEMTVDPRQVIRQLPRYLSENWAVQFHFGQVVNRIEGGHLWVGGRVWQADQILVCSGADFETLYPERFAASGITKVKLQMMRSIPQPDNFRIGPSLCGGLTLTHYEAFSHCASLGSLKERIQEETPFFPEWGIHVMVSQNAQGELTIGDSHEYGLNPEPFDQVLINDKILDYLQSFARFPDLKIAQLWNGVYPKIIGKTEWIECPEPGVTIINALSGAGMTLSFGLAEEVITTQVR